VPGAVPSNLVLLAEEIEEDDEGAPPTHTPGVIKRSWLSQRLIGLGTIAGEYCAVGHSDSIQHLREALAARILHYGLGDLDAGDLRTRAPRRLTQEISRYVFTRAADDGSAVFQASSTCRASATS
jgi:hypothetical protein